MLLKAEKHINADFIPDFFGFFIIFDIVRAKFLKGQRSVNTTVAVKKMVCYHNAVKAVLPEGVNQPFRVAAGAMAAG